ncbi:hypothetical protein [Soonwooa sp.]|uniref:hypothetical protein n=1 Tax=Soonwooa sp. TaxID=1938592 RepID=UPI00262EFA2F|nr:hypothetical protein [Soonwooa sp.]
MKKLLMSAFFAISFGMSVFGQQITYFDEDWQPTKKENMSYYREAYKQGQETLIKDFYKNGTLQMEGVASDATPGKEVYNGKVTWYYPDGKPQSIAEFKKGELNGVSKGYDTHGRITEDVVYKGEGKMSGKYYQYKDEEYGVGYNSITEMKDGDAVYAKVFESEANPMGYESYYKNGSEVETKYFGKNGKALGSRKIDSDGKVKGIEVNFGYDPFRISRIDNYDNNGEVKSYETYYISGEKSQEYTKKNKEASKVIFDKAGKQLAKINYKTNADLDYLMEYSGEDYTFAYDSDLVSTITKYDNFKTVNVKNYDQNGKLKEQINYDGDNIKEAVYYNPDQSVRSKLAYVDGNPSDGTMYGDNSVSKYEKGILVYEMQTYPESGNTFYETKYDPVLKTFNTSVYDENKNLTYTYKKFDGDYSFSAEVTQYKKGKAISKATINDGLLVHGKIRYKDYSSETEQEVKDKWLYTRRYNDNGVLFLETKELLKIEGDEYYRPSSYFYEDYLIGKY